MPRSALVLSTVALTAAALVGSSVEATAASAHTPVGRAALHFSTSRHGQVHAPRSVRPGFAHLRAERTAVVVVKSEHGAGSAKQVLTGLASDNPTKFLHRYQFVGLVLPDQGEYTRLTRGTYYVASAEDSKHPSRVARMIVSGSRVDARLPKSRTVAEDRHETLHTPYSIPRKTWLHVLNRSSSFSNLFVFGVATETTYRTLHDLVEHPTFNKLFAVLGSDGFSGFVDAGANSSTWTHFAGRPGRYVAAVVPLHGSARHQPHLRKGQVRIVHVK